MSWFKNTPWEFVGLLVLACFPIFPFFLVSAAIAIYITFALIQQFIDKPKDKPFSFNILFFTIQIGFYVFLLIISGFKNGFSQTLNYLEPSISLLLFPVVWSVTKTQITRQQHRYVFKTFILSSFVLGLYIFFFSLRYSISHNTDFIMLYKEIPIISIHPHYVGLYFFISIVLLFLEDLVNNKIVNNFLIVYFILMIFSLASGTMFFGLMLFFLIEFFKKTYSKKKKLTFFLLLIITVSAALLLIKPLQKKVTEIVATSQFELPNKQWPTSAQIRIGLNYCATPIINNNWVLGTGIISFENQLNHCYSKFNNAEKIRYNSHNYYYFLIGSAGIFCLLLFLIMLLWHFYSSFKQNNWPYFYFLLIISFSLLTENILSRVYGVVFMLFFMTIFVKNTVKLNLKN